MVVADIGFADGLQNYRIFFFVSAGFYWRGDDHPNKARGDANTAFFNDIPATYNGDRYHRTFGAAGYQVTTFFKGAYCSILRARAFRENN